MRAARSTLGDQVVLALRGIRFAACWPFRRSGGYLVGPGSVVDGRPCTLIRDVPITPLPGWLAELLIGTGQTQSAVAAKLRVSRWTIRRALDTAPR